MRTFAAKPAAAAAPTKKSTGLTGLAVDPKAREKLMVLYRETLDALQGTQDNLLKEGIQKTTEFRLRVVNKFEDPTRIEAEIRCGQIEEVLKQAIKELDLVKFLKQQKVL